MKSRILGLLAVGLLAGPLAAHATSYVYQFTFDAITYDYGYGDGDGQEFVPLSFDAATFSVEVPALMDFGSQAGPYSVSPTGDLNGHTLMSYVEIGGTSGPALGFRDAIELGRPVNTVNGWSFYVDFGGETAILGTFSQYDDWGACRFISDGQGGGLSLCGTGSLTITEAGTGGGDNGGGTDVPEPGTLALLGLGLAGLGLRRRRKAN
jgi:hypothetical protein